MLMLRIPQPGRRGSNTASRVRGGGVGVVWEVQKAVRGSNLPGPSRHLMLTLASLADVDTGVIPDRYAPSLTDLCSQTALGRSTVAEHLNALEDLKWVQRSRPSDYDARVNKAKTQYSISVGRDPASPGGGLVRQADQPKRPSPDQPDTGLVRPADQPDQPKSDIGIDVLVRYTDQASPPGGLEVLTKNSPDQTLSLLAEDAFVTAAPADAKPLPPTAAKRGTRIPDDFKISPKMGSWALEHAPGVNADRELAKFRDYWTAKTGKDATKHDWEATWRNWMRTAVERMAPRAPTPSAPKAIPRDQQCPRHRGYRATTCGLCDSERKGKPPDQTRRAS